MVSIDLFKTGLKNTFKLLVAIALHIDVVCINFIILLQGQGKEGT